MSALLVALAGGILLAGFLPQLPPPGTLLLLFPLALIALLARNYRITVFFAFFIGLGYGVGYGHHALSNLLPHSLEGKDFLVRGRVLDLPQTDLRRTRFVLAVDTATPTAGDEMVGVFPNRVQISWYEKPPQLVSGQEWQLLVRLKPPRGFVNPSGFDYEAWLLRRQIGALGYVRKSDQNQLLSGPLATDISHWRFSLQRWLLNASESPRRSILLALLIGDRSLVEPAQWRLLQQTGTNHLIAISGLHVGFVALLGLMLGGFLGRVINQFLHRINPALVACLCASAFALFYAALAGFSLPTQRALIMVLVAQLAYVLHRSFRPRDALLLALVLVLFKDPLAAYDPGFWLSFGAVAVLLVAFIGRITQPQAGIPGRSLLYSQWVIFVGLLLPLSLLVNSTSLLAPVANILAIPLVTFLVVPALLMAALSRSLFPSISELLLSAADSGLGGLFWFLQGLLDLADGSMNPVVVFNTPSLCLAAAGVLLMLLPRGIPGRWLGFPALLIALLLPLKIRPPLQVTVMDVGQGLAVVVQTPNHSLVYDLGPAYGESFDAGSGILLPYLRQEGIGQLDKLVVSHNDSDHLGGLTGLLTGMTSQQILWGETARPGQASLPEPNKSCHGFAPWTWDQVSFRFLTRLQSSQATANDQSCVLLLEYADYKILLPGDILRNTEWKLLSGDELPAAITLLLAPHHGSRSSSTQAFVDHLRPQWVVYSAGYRNQHGHPHPQVVARYSAAGSRGFSTAESGALEFIWEEKELPRVIEHRVKRRRYWHRQVEPAGH